MVRASRSKDKAVTEEPEEQKKVEKPKQKASKPPGKAKASKNNEESEEGLQVEVPKPPTRRGRPKKEKEEVSTIDSVQVKSDGDESKKKKIAVTTSEEDKKAPTKKTRGVKKTKEEAPTVPIPSPPKKSPPKKKAVSKKAKTDSSVSPKITTSKGRDSRLRTRQEPEPSTSKAVVAEKKPTKRKLPADSTSSSQQVTPPKKAKGKAKLQIDDISSSSPKEKKQTTKQTPVKKPKAVKPKSVTKKEKTPTLPSSPIKKSPSKKKALPAKKNSPKKKETLKKASPKKEVAVKKSSPAKKDAPKKKTVTKKKDELENKKKESPKKKESLRKKASPKKKAVKKVVSEKKDEVDDEEKVSSEKKAAPKKKASPKKKTVPKTGPKKKAVSKKKVVSDEEKPVKNETEDAVIPESIEDSKMSDNLGINDENDIGDEDEGNFHNDVSQDNVDNIDESNGIGEDDDEEEDILVIEEAQEPTTTSTTISPQLVSTPEDSQVNDMVVEASLPSVVSATTDQANSSEKHVTQTNDELINDEKTSGGKRKLEDAVVSKLPEPVKKARVQLEVPSLPEISGFVCTFGDDIAGQLGMRRIGLRKERPQKIKLTKEDEEERFVQVTCGTMFTLCLSNKGQLFSFGCNDECGLGREIVTANADDDEADEIAATPGKIDFAIKVVKVSAGDCFCLALTEEGHVYVWGSFRNENGNVGIFYDYEMPVKKPKSINLHDLTFVDIATGSNHALLLTDEGKVFSFGIGEHGELGRLKEDNVKLTDSNRKECLEAHEVETGERCDKIWAGQHCSFARGWDSGDVYAWGLNNYSQLAMPFKDDIVSQFVPVKVTAFKEMNSSIERIASGHYHSLALDKLGRLYSFGRHLYGVLGIGNIDECLTKPTLIKQDEKIAKITASPSASFAITSSGSLLAWGMCSAQIGRVEDDDGTSVDVWLPKRVEGDNLKSKSVVSVSAGSQHTAIIVADPVQLNGN